MLNSGYLHINLTKNIIISDLCRKKEGQIGSNLLYSYHLHVTHIHK